MMDYKMKGEDALRAHGIDYCIVRSGWRLPALFFFPSVGASKISGSGGTLRTLSWSLEKSSFLRIPSKTLWFPKLMKRTLNCFWGQGGYLTDV